MSGYSYREEIEKIRPLIIASLANDLVVTRLISGAEQEFLDQGIKKESIRIIRVPGALEIPIVLKRAAMSGLYNCYAVLGAVIKGETDHYEHVCRLSNEGVMKVAVEYGLALGNEILTVHSFEQALFRSGGPRGNLGIEAARAALSLHKTFFELEMKHAR